MRFGIIKAIALTWVGPWPVFRLLVVNDANFFHLYIGANNYCFRENDIVSWDGSAFYWHTENAAIRFDLLQTGVTTT